MSDTKNLPSDPANTDISPADMGKIQEYMDQGLPGIAKVDDTALFRMVDMYLTGSTYWQISNALNISRKIIIYLSHKHDWYGARREYLTEMQTQMKARVIDAKLVSKDFLLLLTQAWQKKIGKKLQKYLATDNEAHANEIDLKEVGQLLKTIDMINNLSDEGKDSKGRTPAIGLNLGDGVTIERDGDNKVIITPKEKTLGDMLKKFADSRREEQNKEKVKASSDIETEEPKNKE